MEVARVSTLEDAKAVLSSIRATAALESLLEMLEASRKYGRGTVTIMKDERHGLTAAVTLR